MKKIKKFLSIPSDTSSLVFLRICFGSLMLWELSRYYLYNWIDDLYIKQNFHFKYEWFSWVDSIPGNGMYVVFIVMFFCALFIALGLFYKLSITLFFLLYTYVFLIDQAYYNNHFYLIAIFSFLMIFTPLNHSWSLDCFRGAIEHKNKFPAIWLWLMRFPMTMVYVYGAIAKMESDWLSGKSTRELLGKANEGTILEPLMNFEWMPVFYAWSGMFFDLLVPFAVLWKRTRVPAFITAILFHSHNYFVFPIGVFPLLSLALTVMYFEPEFPRKMIPLVLKEYFNKIYSKVKIDNNEKTILWPHQWSIALLTGFIICQLLIPFRHHLYPGETNWHEVGHYFSWRMMLRQKNIEIKFDITHPDTGETRYAPLDDYLNSSQIRSFAGNPGMNLQFAHHLKELVEMNGGFTPIITARIYVSLNGRRMEKLISESLNLATIPKFESAYVWVEPFGR